MKKLYILVAIAALAFTSCSQQAENTTDNEKKAPIESPELTGSDTTFSDEHYSVASNAIASLKNQDYKKLENYMVTEFLPPQGFDSLEFIVNIAEYIVDKDLPNKESVVLKVGLNSYKGKKIPFKTYDFPFYAVEGKDTVGRSAIVVTFADEIEKNKIANLSFRDY